MKPIRTKVLIVGGGISGLHTAASLCKDGIDCHLVEARNRLGGRILSMPRPRSLAKHDLDFPGAVDLGPSWFWQDQPNMATLIHKLGLGEVVFEQYSKGNTVIESGSGRVQRGVGHASMAGSYRVAGGMHTLVKSLATSVDQHRIHLDMPLRSLTGMTKEIESAVGASTLEQIFTSDYVVLALPPRVVDATIRYWPPLGNQQLMQMRSVPTWMAEHAKFVAIYSSPFWRDAGLSGDALSQRGPLTEMHDASPADGHFGAIFGFVGIPAHQREAISAEMETLAVQQLSRLFGREASKPVVTHYKDWAQDRFTATPQDKSHVPPQGLPSTLADSPWNGRVLFSGSEVSRGTHHSNGYLEGAIESSLQTLQTLKTLLT